MMTTTMFDRVIHKDKRDKAESNACLDDWQFERFLSYEFEWPFWFRALMRKQKCTLLTFVAIARIDTSDQRSEQKYQYAAPPSLPGGSKKRRSNNTQSSSLMITSIGQFLPLPVAILFKPITRARSYVFERNSITTTHTHTHTLKHAYRHVLQLYRSRSFLVRSSDIE